MSNRSNLIIALDVAEREHALDLARCLRDEIAMVKVGLEPFVAHGPGLVAELRDAGVEVFLDLKVHDIPRTAAAAAREASRLGARLLTVHAAGGAEMIGAARDAASESTAIIAVTMLTSLDDDAARGIGFASSVADSASTLGRLAVAAGADGLVCSALELERLTPVGGLRVVPGVRPRGSASGDQKRVATPGEAVSKGATWLVVGRPVLQAEDPVAAARAINAEVAALRAARCAAFI